MDVLLSIRPEFVEKILSGEKKYEYRKAIWTKDSNDINSVLIYETSPVSKVVASFRIGKIIADSPENIWSKTAGIHLNMLNQDKTIRIDNVKFNELLLGVKI